jgi:hypothetical protein
MANVKKDVKIMSKHHRSWNASVYERYMCEGRGCGSGSGYTPWIRVQDFASQGVASRVKGRTTGRVHHLMSNNELAYFYILDWSDSVTDIREQYPLSDLSCAVNIATQAGIKYPADKASGYPYVLTCDFMITTPGGMKARTVKMLSELNNARTLEKLEIERRYWIAQGIDWKIVTEREIPRQKAKNIEWLYTAQDFCAVSYESEKAHDMMLQLLLCGKYSVIEAAHIIEIEFMLPAGIGLQLFKQVVLERKYDIDLNKPLHLHTKGVVA